MNEYDACEQAFKRGYEKGRAEAEEEINRKNAEIELLENESKRQATKAIKEFIATLKSKKGLESFCGYRIFDWELYQIAEEMGVEL